MLFIADATGLFLNAMDDIKPENSESRGRKSEVGGQESELRSKNGFGFFSIEPNIDPMCWHSVVRRR